MSKTTDEFTFERPRLSIASVHRTREKTRTLPLFVNSECKTSFSSIRKPSVNNAFLDNEIFVEDDDSEKNSEKVKVKLMSLWNNVKYGWNSKLKTNFSYESPIWLLGVCYHKNTQSQRKLADDKYSRTSIEMFKHDCYSRIWLTYRRDFPRISGSQFTTDCGWGCMLRSGQMILAEAFLRHYLDRQWRWCGPQSDKADMIHRMIIKWFIDDPNTNSSPFAIHQMVKLGSNFGKKPGDWFGPSSVVHILRDALNEAYADNPVMDNICVYVSQDCTVYMQDVFDLCTRSRRTEQKKRTDDIPPNLPLFNNKASSTFNLLENSFSGSTEAYSLPTDMFSESECTTTTNSSQRWRGVIIFVPVRLGGDKFNPIYTSCIKSMFMHPSCIGIIGGRPKHSLYFVGVQDDKLIYLDPHLCQEAIDIRQTSFPLHSFHCSTPRKMMITRMDPSCTIGFYCHTQQDLINLAASIREITVPSNHKTEYPLFVFAEGNAANDIIATDERVLRVKHCYVDSKGSIERVVESEEFMMI
ncbi:cysteine protease ATG4D-like protein [Leptotrombidium deliense]|uniref:Cysteine protease n=1 Tax=Leptotrombidium deliense TaxID=299467 RepID=A0A443SIC9_9ACAR|nr:cysteine protease ATG4D-like protein [Leptotrombidium deliense]